MTPRGHSDLARRPTSPASGTEALPTPSGPAKLRPVSSDRIDDLGREEDGRRLARVEALAEVTSRAATEGS
jgi:hypothetical protein